MNLENREKDSVAEDLTGRQIGDYVIIRRLGRGGMADVYLADQVSLKRSVALKVLKPELAKDRSYIERFRREAQSAAALVQANIVQIYEVGEFDGLYFISQEYIVGRNLRQHISRYGAVEPVMALSVMRQVALALQKAGEADVIHRDIKPENIMLASNGEVKVTDFGLARINNDQAQKELTQIGVTMGTPLYMSPEQVEGKPVDPRSDIYSLGISAYHMLAGEPPYDGETALAIALKHVKSEPVPLEEVRPDVPAALIELIDKMLKKSPDDRPASAAHLLKELRKVKIDADQDWEQLVEKLASDVSPHSRSDQITDSNLAVTRQLQTVMKGNLRNWWLHPVTLLSIVGLMLGSGFAGNWLAANNSVEDPLTAAISETPEIARMRDVREQYEYASTKNTVEAWNSIFEFFPINQAARDNLHITKFYHDLTRQRLGELYIQRSDWDRALPIYEEFADFRPSEPFFVIGHAGLAIIYEATGDDLAIPDELYLIKEFVEDALNHGDDSILKGDFLERLHQLYKSQRINLKSRFDVS